LNKHFEYFADTIDYLIGGPDVVGGDKAPDRIEVKVG
jgi:hypothetical protein